MRERGYPDVYQGMVQRWCANEAIGKGKEGRGAETNREKRESGSRNPTQLSKDLICCIEQKPILSLKFWEQ